MRKIIKILFAFILVLSFIMMTGMPVMAVGPSAPTVTTAAAGSITISGATLNGTVNDNGVAVTAVTFDYGTDNTYGNSVHATPYTVAIGAGVTPVSAAIGSLNPGVTYHYRVDAAYAGGGGPTLGADMTFTTLAPTATTQAADGFTISGATLHGTVNDIGVAITAVTFDWGTDTNYGTNVHATPYTVAIGAGATGVTATVGSLSPGITYHYRVNAAYASGITHGSDLTFTTLAPTATTAAAGSITINGAILNGSVNAIGTDITTVTFDWGTDTTYGHSAAATPSPVTAGTGATSVSTAAISSMSPGITYHYRVNAAYSGAAAHGADMIFTTLGPTATTGAAGSITINGAILNGSVNAIGTDITTVTFDWGTDTTYGHSAAATPSPVTAGTGATSVSTAAISSMSPGTIYHFRVDAAYSGATAYGADMTFTTLAPTATTVAADGITISGATLHGSVNPTGVPITAVTFDYSTDTSYNLHATATQTVPITGTTDTPVSAFISGLNPGVTYHYRVDAAYAGGGGPTLGVDMTFTTLAPATAAIAASNITAGAATLNGSVNDNGVAVSAVTFEFGTTTGYGTSLAAAPPTIAAGAGTTSISVAITGLLPGTLYHYRVDAAYAGGTTLGADMTFTTLVPTAATGAAGSITLSGATLNGSVNDNGAAINSVIFEYGTDTAYGSSVSAAPGSVAAGTGVTSVSAAITGLTAGTTYHYRVDAAYSGGTAWGADMTFTIVTYTLTYTAGANGTISGTSPQTVVSGGTGTVVTAVPSSGYKFVNWSDGVATAARTDTNVTANISVTASFIPNTYTLTYTANAHGSITGSSHQTVNAGSSGTAVTAVPDTGYHFISWSDGVKIAARTDNNVNVNITVAANFAINTYTLIYATGSNGSITGTSPQTVNYSDSGTTVTAVPADGYEFVSWSDGVTTADRTDTNITANVSVTASFAVIPPTTPTPVTGVGSISVGSIVDTSGVFEVSANLASSDSNAVITIDAGTTGLNSDNSPLSTITVTRQATPPAPPAGSYFLGIGYDFGPNGATFSKPVRITITYNPAELPAGVSETNLVLAYYDTATKQWVTIPGGIVNTADHTITVSVSHFTLFSVMSPKVTTTTTKPANNTKGLLITLLVLMLIILITVVVLLVVMRRPHKK